MRAGCAVHHFVTASPLSSCLLVGSDISREAAVRHGRQGLSHGSASRVGDHLSGWKEGMQGWRSRSQSQIPLMSTMGTMGT
jgi:hypothetical protein